MQLVPCCADFWLSLLSVYDAFSFVDLFGEVEAREGHLVEDMYIEHGSRKKKRENKPYKLQNFEIRFCACQHRYTFLNADSCVSCCKLQHWMKVDEYNIVT